MKKAALIGTVIAASMIVATQAHAQCGSGFGVTVCAGVYVNTPVYTPPVIVESPPVIYQAPPVVYTQPAPIVVQQPTVMVPPPRLVRPMVRHRGLGFGVRGSAGYAGLSEIGMWGGGAVVRYIASPRFGMELGVDVFGGNGYEGAERMEIPVTMNALWFLNPRSRAQLFLLGGFGVDFAEVEANGDTDEPIYVGGQLGVGVEFLIGRHIGLTLDIRGFVRGRVNEREEGNLAHDGSCRGSGDELECTNYEAGATGNIGFNFYL